MHSVRESREYFVGMFYEPHIHLRVIHFRTFKTCQAIHLLGVGPRIPVTKIVILISVNATNLT